MAEICLPYKLDFSRYIREGDLVCYGQGPAEPLALTPRLMAQRHKLKPFTCFVGIGWSDTADPHNADIVSFRSYCGAGTNRRLAQAGKLTILPIHYSLMAAYLAARIDVLLIQVAPTSHKGVFSFGLACEYLLPLVKTARVVIAEVNENLPETLGEQTISVEDIDLLVYSDLPLLEPGDVKASDVERRIAGYIADLVEDGATLQIGLGSIPEAVLSALSGHRDLGIHSGLIADPVVDLVECGAVSNARKPADARHMVCGLLAGGRKLTSFVRQNRTMVRLHSTNYTHDAQTLAGLDRLTAVNSAVEVDLLGQVNSEVAGGVYVGAVGGLLDFIRGAHASKGGLPIVALPSTAKSRAGTVSRIVTHLSGPATLPHADAPIIVTEYGVADLRGKTHDERRRQLIDIAHPDFRDAIGDPGRTTSVR